MSFTSPLKGLTKRLFPGLVNFVLAVAYHLCLNLPAAFSPFSRALYLCCAGSLPVTYVWDIDWKGRMIPHAALGQFGLGM